MATNINDYIYTQILEEELKLNRVSNKLGKIILKTVNIINGMDDSSEYENSIQILKHMRLEMLNLEKKYYDKEIESGDVEMYVTSYCKGLMKIRKQFEKCEDKRMPRVLDKIDELVKKLKKIKAVL